MTTVHHFKSNLRDLAFNLFEVLDIEHTTLAHERFASLDRETVEATLAGLRQLAETTLAESFAAGDREGLSLDGEGNVTIPASVTRALKAYYDHEWHLLEMPEHLGGFGAPPSVVWAAMELVIGANPVVSFYLLGLLNARIIDDLGTEAQKARFCRAIVERRWGGTMVLTEPDAGSDVGAGTTRARQIDGEVYEIEGVKRFITNGDFNDVENIIHLVLARPEGARAGTKGLSLFIVPKLWVEEDGTLGERNGAWCTGIEEKMGIHASSTCEMTFGDHRGRCRGLLVGGVHDGIRQMFQVIEQARMAIGVKATSTLSTAYLNSLAYAKERVQGPDLLQARDRQAPRVAIIRHPDVRRMLMLQKCFAEGMRALYFFTGHIQDQVAMAGGHRSPDAGEPDRLNDLLLPIIKGYCSERSYELLATSLQVYGGSGYMADYPIEQYIRDAKIDTVYEGTTHIQALDLFFRKIARDGGRTLRALLGQVEASLAAEVGGEALGAERAAVASSLGDVQAIFVVMMKKVQESLYHAAFQGNRILFALGELLIGWLLLRHAAIAQQRLEGATGDDRHFYAGRVASARFFCRNVLPNTAVARRVVEASSLDLMDLPDEAF